MVRYGSWVHALGAHAGDRIALDDDVVPVRRHCIVNRVEPNGITATIVSVEMLAPGQWRNAAAMFDR